MRINVAPLTRKVFCVLYDLNLRRRIKEFRFDDTPVGNSGVAQRGGWYLALNYGRMDRLRKVTGYGGAFDPIMMSFNKIGHARSFQNDCISQLSEKSRAA